MYFNPCDYGDPYTKKTALWGVFNVPIQDYVYPSNGSKMWHSRGNYKGMDRSTWRSITPQGFANAFFEANR